MGHGHTESLVSEYVRYSGRLGIRQDRSGVLIGLLRGGEDCEGQIPLFECGIQITRRLYI